MLFLAEDTAVGHPLEVQVVNILTPLAHSAECKGLQSAVFGVFVPRTEGAVRTLSSFLQKRLHRARTHTLVGPRRLPLQREPLQQRAAVPPLLALPALRPYLEAQNSVEVLLHHSAVGDVSFVLGVRVFGSKTLGPEFRPAQSACGLGFRDLMCVGPLPPNVGPRKLCARCPSKKSDPQS